MHLSPKAPPHFARNIFIRFTRKIALACTLPFVFVGVAAADINLTFGTYTTDKPTEVVKKFGPILKYLSHDLETRLGEPVKIKFKIASDYDEGIADIVEGRVDFARFGPASYILAKAGNQGIGILAMETVKGQKTFMGVIAVHADSEIATLADLKGSSFAFGNRLSTIGRFLAQQQLLNAGITGTDLARFEYLGRHDRVGAAVGRGTFDAGALKQSTFSKLQDKGVPIRTLVEFQNVTKPWLYKSGLDQRISDALREAFLSPSDPQAVQEFVKTGFVQGSDADYQPVRDAMEQSKGFGG